MLRLQFHLALAIDPLATLPMLTRCIDSLAILQFQFSQLLTRSLPL